MGKHDNRRDLTYNHPTELLAISQNCLGREIGVPPRRINEIILGKCGITADTALRLARYFKMSPEFWMGLQQDFELDREADRLMYRIEKEVQVCREI